MNLKNLSNEILIQSLDRAVQNERKAIHTVLLHILEVDDRRLYLDIGFPSMFAYLTQHLKYSEASAYTRISSARLLRQVPEVTKKLAEGSINLTQLSQLQKCLKHQKAEIRSSAGADSLPGLSTSPLEIINQIENKNGFETKQILSKAFDLPLERQETLRPQKDNSIRLEITLSAEQFADLNLAKSLCSHVCHEGALADVITYLAQCYNKKKLRSAATTCLQN